MVAGLWGKKVGMTQLFANDKVIPVTVIDLTRWIVIDERTEKRDGYNAVRVGCLRSRYAAQSFSLAWLQNTKKYFTLVREVRVNQPVENLEFGKPLNPTSVLAEGDLVDVFGKTKGLGFAGVVRRHNFSGAPGSHGSTMGKKPGSIGFMTACGRVIKGKKLPGQMGNKNRMTKNLKVVKIDPIAQTILVKGSVPGKANSFIFMRKV